MLALIDSSDIDMLVSVESIAEAIKNATGSAPIKVKNTVSEMNNLGTKITKNVTNKAYDLKGAI